MPELWPGYDMARFVFQLSNRKFNVQRSTAKHG